MKKLLTLATIFITALSGYSLPASGAEAGNSYEGERVVANQLIVSVDKRATDSQIAELFGDTARKYSPISPLDPHTFLVSTKLYTSIADQISFFEASEIVEYAEPNGFVYVDAVSDDPYVTDGSLWGMGAATGSVARTAWEAGYTGSSQVYVAVIDSGIEVSHPDLAANVWVNSGEVAGNGIDDDGNGFIDDVHGFDFVNDDGSVFDESENYHGTHVAGTIAAVGGNGVGVAGVSWNTKLISAKMINADGGATYSDAIQAIDYVTMLRTQKGLDIIASNNSWGGSGYSRSMEEAIERGGDAGIIFVAAAGNDRNDNDGDGHNPVETYPSSYDCSTPDRPWDCVVSVGAHDRDGSLAFFSSYGANTVDLLAPGVDIVSTMPGNDYDSLSGTSMATPHVTGAFALCVGANRGMSAYRAIDLLKASVTVDASLAQAVATSGRLNVNEFASDCSSEVAAYSGVPTFHIANATYTDRIRLDWQDSVIGEYELEIQKSVGPAGCSAQASWQHHAWIGPSLSTYPAVNLDEAEFHCFRIRAWKESSSTSWVYSNVSITWTSNLPFIFGEVLTQDGTPVANIPVRWLASGSAQTNAIPTVTNASGEYVLQVPNGVSGDLYVETSKYPSRSTPTSPLTPWGLTAGGKLTVTQDTVVDITLPAFDLVTIRVVEADSNEPVAGAIISKTDNSFRFCKNIGANGYLPFPGATAMSLIYGDACHEYPAGTSSNPVTNANGELTLAIVDAAMIDPYYIDRGLTFEARDPNNTARVARTELDVEAINGSTTVTIELGGNVELSGQVLTQNGTPVANIPVRWLASGSAQTNAIPTVTNASGEYVLQVPNGVSGDLYVETSKYPSRSTPTSPLTPWGLTAGGKLTVTQDTVVDITLPAFDLVTIRVVEADSNEPVAGAIISKTDNSFRFCKNIGANGYLPFPGATAMSLIYGDACHEYPAGTSSNPVTNANGELTLAIVDAAMIDPYYIDRGLTFEARDPNNTARVARTELDVEAINGSTTVTIELGGNVELSGQVLTQNGTPVANIPVRWLASGSAQTNAIPTVTNASGEYVLQVPNGVSGDLYVETSKYPSRSTPTSPLTPWGLTAGGKLTVTQDTVVDITLPAFDLVTIRVVEADSNEPVAGAIISKTDNSFRFCKNIGANGYLPFPGATAMSLIYGDACHEYPAGTSSNPVTNANGELTLAIVDAAMIDPYYIDRGLTFEARHPIDRARVKQQVINVNEIVDSANFTIILPGTPSKPEQPTAMAEEGSVTLTWDEPWNGGAFIDFYEVWISRNAEGPFEKVSTGTCAGELDPELRSCEVTGLEGGVPYYFAIIAHNEVGYSDLSISTMAVPLRTILDLDLTPTPTISGIVQVGQALTAVAGAWDAGVTVSYRWLRDGEGIDEATSSTYVLTQEDEGHSISVRVTGSKDGYNSVEKVSAETVEVAARPLSNFSLVGTPSITGSLIVGQTLTANSGTWDNGAAFTYRWIGNGEPLASEAGSTLVLTEIHVGMKIKVEVTAAKDGFNSQSILSAESAAVAFPVIVLSDFTQTPTPVITGAAVVGEWLTATVGEWDPGASLEYGWWRNGRPIVGATSLSYQLTEFDLFGEVSFVVTATKAGFNSAEVSSLPITGIVSPEAEEAIPTLQEQPTPATPIISGTPQVGGTLTAQTEIQAQSAVVLEYQWLKDGVAIFGATSSNYAPQPADVGAMLSLRVTSKRDGYLDASVTSAEVGPVRDNAAINLGGGGGFVPVVSLPATPITTNPIPKGTSLVVLDSKGIAMSVSSALTQDKKLLELSFGTSKLQLKTTGNSNFSEAGKLLASASGSLELAASGFQPNSKVTAYLVPTSSLMIAGFRSASNQVVELGSITVAANGSFALNAALNAAPGNYLLQLSGTTDSGTQTTIAIEAQVTGDVTLKTWAKRLTGNTEAKLYAKNIVGAGKVSFKVNGKEIAWANAKDQSDPKLRVVTEGPMAGANYLVRTIKLQKGKNILEVYVDGARTSRVSYSLK